jgi:hypothetical protein
MATTRSIEILRLGRHTSLGAGAHQFGEAEAAALIANYDAAKDPAPLVIGHPKLTDRALGWVDGMRLEGDVIVADISGIPAEFAESEEAQGFRRVSASFYPPGHAASPNGAGYYLRHVGLLGAHAPSVKGLAAVEFGDAGEGLAEITTLFSAPKGPTVTTPNAAKPKADQAATETATVDFAEREKQLSQREADIAAREEQAAAAEAARVHQDHVDFAETLVGEAKLSPAGKGLVVGVLDHLAAPRSGEPTFVEFAEAEGATPAKLDPADAFKKLFDRAKPMIEFGEAAKDDGDAPKGPAISIPTPAGYDVDANRAAVHNRALQIEAAEKVPYVDAAIRAEAELGSKGASAP